MSELNPPMIQLSNPVITPASPQSHMTGTVMDKFRDPWVWRVHYTDGTTFDEFDDAAPQGHGFAEVELPRVAFVELLPTRPWLPNHIVGIDSARGQRPIFFRRSKKIINPNSGLPVNTNDDRITVLGWQRTILQPPPIGPINIKSFVFYFPDGSSLVSDNHQAV